jgi:hypothetical protein
MVGYPSMAISRSSSGEDGTQLGHDAVGAADGQGVGVGAADSHGGGRQRQGFGHVGTAAHAGVEQHRHFVGGHGPEIINVPCPHVQYYKLLESLLNIPIV